MSVSKKERSPCPIDALLSVIDGRWKPTILWLLTNGPMRTSELKRKIPGITERVLIRHLQELISDGILKREEVGEGTLRMAYSLSEYGWTLQPPLRAMCEWGTQHLTLAHER